MKKIIFILFFLFLFAGIALAVFVATFNVDQFRPVVVDKLEAAIGKPVQMDRISLGWHGGLALEITGLAVFPEKNATEPLAKFSSASILVQPFPLLHKELDVSSLILSEPVIHLIKGPDGRIKGLEPAREEVPAPAPAIPSGPPVPAPQKKEGGAAAAASLMINRIKIEDGEFIYQDESARIPTNFDIKNIDLTLRNVSLIRPIDIKGRLSVFSDSQNLEFSGRFHYLMNERVGVLENLKSKLNLSGMNVRELVRAVPLLANALAIKDTLQGNLELEMSSLKLNEEGLSRLESSVRFQNGRVELSGIDSPIEDINLTASVQQDRIEVPDLSARVAGAKISGSGNVNQFSTRPLSAFQLRIQNLSLEKVLPPPQRQDDPQVEGTLSLTVQGTAQGRDWPLISETLAGQGQFFLDRPVARNVNVLREIFDRLSLIPGLVETLNRRLPASYQEKLNTRDTILNPIEFPFVIRNGVISFDQVKLVTDSFQLNAGGNVGLGGGVRVQALLFVDSDLSNAFVRSVRELQYLTDQNGQLQIPVTVQGIAPHISVVPDLQFVASRLAVSKIGQYLGGRKRQATSANQAASDQQESSEGATAPAENQPAQQEPTSFKKLSGRKILSQFLQGALDNSSQSQNQGTGPQ